MAPLPVTEPSSSKKMAFHGRQKLKILLTELSKVKLLVLTVLAPESVEAGWKQ